MFAPDDDRPGVPPVAVLSHHAWQAIYGADTSIVGSAFVIEGHPFTIIGVAPRVSSPRSYAAIRRISGSRCNKSR